MFFKNLCRFHSGSGSSLNAVLFDAWVQCAEGQWSTSAFYLNIKTRHTNKKRGTRKWMLSGEMDAAFGSHVADAMRQHKANDATLWEKETRFHPELPQKEETPGCFFHCFLFCVHSTCNHQCCSARSSDSTCAYAKMLKILRCVKRSSDFTVALTRILAAAAAVRLRAEKGSHLLRILRMKSQRIQRTRKTRRAKRTKKIRVRRRGDKDKTIFDPSQSGRPTPGEEEPGQEQDWQQGWVARDIRTTERKASEGKSKTVYERGKEGTHYMHICIYLMDMFKSV